MSLVGLPSGHKKEQPVGPAPPMSFSPKLQILCTKQPLALSGHNINRYIEDLRYLQDRINVSSCRCCEVVGRTALAPAVYEFSCAAGEAGSHVGIAEGKDRSFLVDAFCYDELEVSVTVLRNSKVGNRTGIRIELGQVSAAGLAVEDFHDLHGRFLAGISASLIRCGR